MDYNKVVLLGRVGQDPEVKQVGGKTVATFGLATSSGPKDSPKTDWHRITAWEKTAEIARDYIHRGDRVLVEGRISYSESGEGDSKRTYTQITAFQLINLSPKVAGAAAGANSNATTAAPGANVTDQDIPF